MDSVSQMGELTESDRQELRMLYGVCASDIALYTRQQWSAGSFAIAIYAMLLVGAYQIGNASHGNWESWLLVVFTWIVCVSGVAAVKRMQNSIVGGRRRLERVRWHFGRAVQEVWAIPKPPEDIHRLLYCVMGFSAFVVSWLVLDKAYAVVF